MTYPHDPRGDAGPVGSTDPAAAHPWQGYPTATAPQGNERWQPHAAQVGPPPGFGYHGSRAPHGVRPTGRGRRVGWLAAGAVVIVIAAVVLTEVSSGSSGRSSGSDRPVVGTDNDSDRATAQQVAAIWNACHDSLRAGDTCTPEPDAASKLCSSIMSGTDSVSVFGPTDASPAALRIECTVGSGGDVADDLMIALPSQAHPSSVLGSRYRCDGDLVLSSSCDATGYGDLSTQAPDDSNGYVSGYTLAGNFGVISLIGTDSVMDIADAFGDTLIRFGVPVELPVLPDDSGN